MAELYVGGEKIGTLADLEKLLPELRAKGQNVEICDESGRSLAKIYPQGEPDPNAPLVPWDPTLTREELDRRAAEPSYTFEEVKKRLGWE
jgi:hypothetical protein